MRVAVRRPAGVNQKDDWRLQSLRSMNRQYAHLIAALIHLPLYLRTSRFKCGQEILQARHANSLLGQTKREELVQNFACLVTQPRDETLAPSISP